MEKEIKKILKDLYKIDSDLRKKEKELKAMIKKIIEAKPEVELDEEFRHELKMEILEKFSQKEAMDEKNNNFLLKFSFLTAGATFALVIILPLVFFLTKNPENKFSFDLTGQEIRKVSKRAFGDLRVQDLSARSESMGVEGLGAGGGASVSSENAKLGQPSILPRFFNLEFTYNGEAPELTDDFGKVYKKEFDRQIARNLAGLLGNIDLGVLDISKFSDVELRNLMIAEDKEKGYFVYFDFYNGNISITQNWQRWRSEEDIVCMRDGDCGRTNTPNSMEEMPDNSEMVAVADKFLRDYGIDTDKYGEGQVNENWRESYLMAKERGDEMYPLPEQVSVIYPLVLNGKEIYDERGNPTGLSVNVHTVYEKVASVHGLTAGVFLESDYELETDFARIKKVAEFGGLTPNFFRQGETVDLELGEPREIYVRYWQNDFDNPSEIFAPALLFEVKDKPENTYIYTENVVVPLAKDLLSQIEDLEKQRSENPPIPMPIEEPVLIEEKIEE